MLLTMKSFELFPKHNGYGFISFEFISVLVLFALNWYVFKELINKKLLLPL